MSPIVERIPQAALDLGHKPVWDPPASGAALRWTCACGRAALKLPDSSYAYGSATREDCPLRYQS